MVKHFQASVAREDTAAGELSRLDMEVKSPKLVTPVEVVNLTNPLVSDVGKMCKKWHKRWPGIDRPWPIEGTLNPDVIKAMQALVVMYKADQRKGKKGQKRQEKRQRELRILELFNIEGQKLIKAANEKKEKAAGIIDENKKETEKMQAEINTPYTHVTATKKPPPYEKEVRFKKMYPQLPVSSQEGQYPVRVRTKKGKTTDKMCPVVIRGQNLEYKPWEHTDLSDILEKLPILQNGAHPWIATLEELMVGTHPATGDIKRLLANLVGVPAMEELFDKAGIARYVATSVNDSELFAANRGRLWGALRETFPTNVHPDNILIEPLGQEENPRAYVSRAHQMWRNITGNDPELNQMEQFILRAKIQKGLPLQVRSKLAEVVGLGSMAKGVYTDHIAHYVELHRKKKQDQREQDQETLRKLTQIQLMNN
ncbi:uncharacterized protein V6R79_025872 [Siganus canaliculatus]